MEENSSTSANVLYNYAASPANAIAISNVQAPLDYGYYINSVSGQKLSIYWDRLRYSPPNGVNLAVSFGNVIVVT